MLMKLIVAVLYMCRERLALHVVTKRQVFHFISIFRFYRAAWNADAV